MDNKDHSPSVKDIEQYSLLRTWIAGKLESLHEYHEAGKYWVGINEDVEALMKADSREAFKFAVETLEPGPNKVDPSARFREWWQGTALIILANHQVEPYLFDELQKDKSELLSPLDSFLDYKPPEAIKVKDDLSDYPETFNLVMAMVLVNGLKDKNLQSISSLQEKTQKLLEDGHMGHIIGLYHTISDDKELVEPLYRIIQKE